MRQLSRPRGRAKVFGEGCPRPLDRNAKVRIMHRARALSNRVEKGKAYGPITAKALAVLQALLWGFHNARSGLCFPSYEKIAEVAHCARSTVADAIKALEQVGLLSWMNRIVRIRERCPVLGSRIRIIRTSNAYHFHDPQPTAKPLLSSKSDFRSGTTVQDLSSLPAPALDADNPLHAALLRLGKVIGAVR
jgi:hypothetical protein